MANLADMMGGPLDTSEIDENAGGSFEPLPLGVYDFEVSDVELKETKAGGTMLVIESTVLAPSHTGRKIWTNLNIINAKESVWRGARADLQRIAAACGLAVVNDTDDLLGRTFSCAIRTETSKDPQYPDKQVLSPSTAKSIGDATPAPAKSAPPRPAAKPAAPAKAPPPWAKGKAA